MPVRSSESGQLILFLQQLNLLLDAGVSIERSLEVLAEIQPQNFFQAFLLK